MLKLWALRYSVARGWQWIEERTVTAENAEQWLAIYRADEPTVKFQVSATKIRL